MPKTQEELDKLKQELELFDKQLHELSEDELKKAAGGDYDEYRVNLVVGKIQNTIDILTNHPLFAQIECCNEAKVCLEDAKNYLSQFDFENAFYRTNEARSRMLNGIASQPEYANFLSSLEDRIRSISTSIVEFVD